MVSRVTPLAGVWIEILCLLPCRSAIGVTPLAGVWIEIFLMRLRLERAPVTPLAGVWIEINGGLTVCRNAMSLPSRECGLK